MNKGKKLLTERFFLSWAGERTSATVRMTLKMKDAIDGTLLSEAVEATRRRYPYYQVKIGIKKDENNSEYFVYDDNSLPWVVKMGQQAAILMSKESNLHLLSFCYWDDCIAIDFFHGLTDGTGGYNLLRTLLYEYCRRRYDNTLNREGVRVEGDTIAPEEWTDPASLPKPDNLNPLPIPELPKSINLITQAKTGLNDGMETVNILVDETQMMQYVSNHDTSPATLVTLFLSRAIAKLHPNTNEGVPIITLAINRRPALGCPLAGQTMMGGLFIALRNETRYMDIDFQQTVFRSLVAFQSNRDNVAETFWKSNEQMDMLDRIPTVEGRHQAMASAYLRIQNTASAAVSYVGKACLGEAEKYVCALNTEVDSLFAITVEMSAVGGTFCINWMQRCASDLYLDAFLDEFRQAGLETRIDSRHPLRVAKVADYRHTAKLYPQTFPIIK